ncbi:MAG: homocysteine S-methyltransferase [Burkholderiales bacterium PBB6]|nr:MAG: homocysteine S-methyltransferase [Burkholderiales bacterium PBB6]
MSTSNPLAAWLARSPRLILDGALATELERRGADLKDPLWSARLLMEQPDLIRQVHLDYYLAGADVATTASYQASFSGFAQRGLNAEQAADLMRLSVQLASEARDQFWQTPGARDGRHFPLVAASVGPYGAVLADGSEYRGHYGLSEAQLQDFHRPRLQVLANAGADLLAVETVPCALEARAVARLLAAEFPGTSAWISLSCRDAAHSCEGDSVEAIAAELDGLPSVAAIGVNCTAPEHLSGLITALRRGTTKPVLVYPNAGEVYDAEAKVWRGGADPRPFAHMADDWAAAGATLIGGCCRTTPADIHGLFTRWTSTAA